VTGDDEAWADVGRRVNAMADELTAVGFDVAVRWDRPHGRVDVTIRPPVVAR
jgi:hypothetical protein